MSHHCHAVGCGRLIPPRLMFCLQHWRMVHRKLQITIWNEYRPGQEVDKRPSLAYLCCQQAAVAEVASKEGRHADAAQALENSRVYGERMKAAGQSFRKPGERR